MYAQKNTNIICSPCLKTTLREIVSIHQHRVRNTAIQFQLTLSSQDNKIWKYCWQINTNALKSIMFQDYYKMQMKQTNSAQFETFARYCLSQEMTRLIKLKLNPMPMLYLQQDPTNDAFPLKLISQNPHNNETIQRLHNSINEFEMYENVITTQINLSQLGKCYIALYESIQYIRILLHSIQNNHNSPTSLESMMKIMKKCRRECESLQQKYDGNNLSTLHINQIKTQIANYHKCYHANLIRWNYFATLLVLLHHPVVQHICNHQNMKLLDLLSNVCQLYEHPPLQRLCLKLQNSSNSNILKHAQEQKNSLSQQTKIVVQQAALPFENKWRNWTVRDFIAYFIIKDITSAQTKSLKMFFQSASKYQWTSKHMQKLHEYNLQLLNIHDTNTQSYILHCIEQLPKHSNINPLSSILCHTCMLQLPNVIFLPCKHMLLCQKCIQTKTNKYISCPACDKQICTQLLVYHAGF